MADLVRLWPEAVGAQIARNAWPARFTRDGTLLVHAKDSVWAYELGQREAEIRERLGELVPSRLRFLPGPLPEPDAEAPGSARLAAVQPTPETLAEAQRLTAAIASEELRDVVARAIAVSLVRAGSGRGFW
jgi:hypothetical protein